MGIKFLLVDNDSDDRDLFCEALQEIDPQITCYASAGGRKAIAALTAGEIGLPDIIFLDINMPVMNGWQCISVLKATEAYKHIPVIMYSTATHADDAEKAYNAGALCFFTKPSDFQELIKSLGLVVHHVNNNSLPLLMRSSPLFTTVSFNSIRN